MTYVYGFNHQHDLTFPELKSLIGGKAANITVMAVKLGLPVPPGFTISTDACKAYLSSGWPDGLDAEIRTQMTRLESIVGRRFGDPSDPLLVSVRSGAPISMPGMMDTILNLGLTQETEAGLAGTSGDPAFAADCLRRFRQMYESVVGEAVPADPWQQVRGAVEAVFRSWNSDRARTYRQHEGIPDDLGTAVTIQAMVFGNRGADSCTGVLFTRNPATGEPTLYGDVLFDAQGEDVVAGTHQTQSLGSIDERLPEVGRELRDMASTLEHYYADCCDIEFTVECGKLWLLQVRVGKRSPQAALRMAVDMAEDPDFPLTRAEAVERVAKILAHPPAAPVGRTDRLVALTTGSPASPGLASGEIVTEPDAAESVADAGRKLILVRAETSPDDVHGIARAAGILTSRGGLVSHAAVVARAWGIPAVVGAAGVEVGEGSVSIGGRSLAVGETITIDGSTGEVFAGEVAGGTTCVPEATVLLGWAHELGIQIGDADAEPETVAGEGRAATADEAVRVLAIKGFVMADSLAAALLATSEQAQDLLAGLIGDGLVEDKGGMFRLTEAGRARGRDLQAIDRDRWGATRACSALDAFLVLDHRMKETVTAWQLKPSDGEPVMNDHTDREYDARILGQLASLHADASAWLVPLVAQFGRLETYRTRLERAEHLALDGDQRYVASPRVDSYHSVWFELHEELIVLAGRNRADEVAAGRA